MDVRRGADRALSFVDVALDLASISKRFGAVTALDAATLTVRRGTLHALLGENGAGKTTLMRIAYGMLQPDSGTVTVDGKVQEFRSPADAIEAGMGMVHQHYTLVPAMTVAENIVMGGHGKLDRRLADKNVKDLAEQTGLLVDPAARVADLPVGAQQRVEILKALSRDARILVLDEPTAVLTPTEARELLEQTRALVQRGGTAIIITHKLREALEFANDITVLRAGRTVWSGSARDATQEALVTAMVGESPVTIAPVPRRMTPSGSVVLSLNDVTVRSKNAKSLLSHVTLEVRSGELLGIAAVEGNGQRELVRVLAGRLVPDEGTVTTPNGIGFVPEDRMRDALAADLTLTENVALLGAGSRRGIIDWKLQREKTRLLMTAYDVRAGSENVRVATLSGGNQQKLVIGRELEGESTSAGLGVALVVENPTRGLDVNATVSVHERLRTARDGGAAVVVYSSDLDEVIGLADRVVVVREGKVSAIRLERDAIARAMLAADFDAGTAR